MGWIQVTDTFQVYSLSDVIAGIFTWLFYFIEKISPIYYFFLFLSLVFIIIFALAYRLKTLSKVVRR